MKMTILVGGLLLCGFCMAGRGGRLYAASFTPLGDLPGQQFRSIAGGVSADGAVVVGSSESGNGFGGNVEAFRWTSTEGMVSLGDLRGGLFNSRASGVSADGFVVVGGSSIFGGAEAFRWTTSEGMVGLGDLPGGRFSSVAQDVSADGSVVVGVSDPSDFDPGPTPVVLGVEAFRWTSTEGMVGLGDLPGGDFQSNAFGVSADGSVVVGGSSVSQDHTLCGGQPEAFRWTSAEGMIGLGFWPGGCGSSAADVSADGSVVVGHAGYDTIFLSSLSQAFRWTSHEGMVGLGLLPGRDQSRATAVSADGSVVVGTAGFHEEAFVWDSTNGMQSVRDVLLGLGVDVTGWQLTVATGVSSNGMVIVGNGINPDGNTEAWRAVLAVPEPSSTTLMAITGLLVGLMRRRGFGRCGKAN